MRIYVQVPETYAHDITPELTAELQFAEHPGQAFPARLAHTSDALDPGTRTQLIQLEVDNDKGELLSGGYAQVHLKLPSSWRHRAFAGEYASLPRRRNAGGDVIDPDGKALLKPITIGRDYGKEVEVKSGIEPDEIIIVNPPDSLRTGQAVKVVKPGEQDKDDDDKDDDK